MLVYELWDYISLSLRQRIDKDFYFWVFEKVTQFFDYIMALQSLYSIEYSHIAILLDLNRFLTVSSSIEIPASK